MNFDKIKQHLTTHQLTGWTDNLWNKKSGELWFLVKDNVEEGTLEYNMTIIDSEFRKEDKFGQCPTLHESEKKSAWAYDELECPALCLYIFANAVPDCNIDSEELSDIIKSCWGKHRYWEQFHKDMVFVQDHQDDVVGLLSKVKLYINDFYGFMYRFAKELIDIRSLGSSCSGCSSIIDENKEDDGKKREYNWFFNTHILFSPTSRSKKKSFSIHGFPYTMMLHGMPPCMPNNWVLFASSAAEDFHKTVQKSKKVAMWMPAVLLSYIADESRKRFLGNEENWYFGNIDFKSRDTTWAFHDCIDVSQLNFHVNGAAIYNTYLADALAEAKKQFQNTPGCELMSEDDMWCCIYHNEYVHWNEDCLLKEILPETVFQEYTQYMEAYFAYFRKKHPCVVTQSNKTIINSKLIEDAEIVEDTSTPIASKLFRTDKNTLQTCWEQFMEIITTAPNRGKQKILLQIKQAANTIYFNPNTFGHEELANELNRLQKKYNFKKMDVDAAFKS